MEPSNTRKTGASHFEPFVHDTSFKGKHMAQRASPMEEKDPQDRSIIAEPPAEDSSFSGSDWSHKEVDEINPDDSISATAKQPPVHRTKRSVEPQIAYLEDADEDGNPIDDTGINVSGLSPGVKGAANVSRTMKRTLTRYYSSLPKPTHLNTDSIPTTPHQQQEPQSVSSSVYTESGPVSPQVSSYPHNGSLEPGPQGVAGRISPPARYHDNAGYMPPSQGSTSRPYRQRPIYEGGKEMVPYQMGNPSTPAQGVGAPPAATVEKQSRKGKERPLSVHFLGAKSPPDGPSADQGGPGKDSAKSEDDAAVLRLPADVDAVYNSAEARDLTVHLELDLFRDVDEELEEFNRLARMGNFTVAESFFKSYLKEHMASDPFIFVQYAEMLLEKGDFKSVLLLDGDSVFGKRGFASRKDQEKSESEEPLERNWMLVRAMALFHSQHELHKLRVLSLGMRLTCLAPDRTHSRSLRERGLSDWADWKSIYRQLLAEQRIWDFRDVLIATCVSYDTDQALSAFLDHPSPIEGMVADWQTGTPDESTELALLDILSFIALNSDQSLDDGGLAEACLRLAEPIGNTLMDRFPHTVHSRPFIQWLISKAVVKNSPEQFAYLSDYAGLAICPKSAGIPPYYIPIRRENPGWMPQDLTPAARDVLEAALKASREMQDYETETLCLTQLALGTKDPGAYLRQLGQLQKKQHNMVGFLSTCLTRYLICRDDESKQALLEDLNSFGSWKDPSDLIIPVQAAARDVLQHALSRGSAKSPNPSITSASRYSLHLPEPFKSVFRHLPQPRITKTGEDPRPSTETPRVEQHSGSESKLQKAPENKIRPCNTHNRGSRVGNKDQANTNNQPAAPGFYPSPWAHYGLPPYYPMNMMYGAPPLPPTESPQPRPPLPATAEKDRPKTQLELMKELLDLLLAERKDANEQANLESKIREDAEHVFKIRMEKMQQAQEDAKKEVELAKIAAERAARARIEEEHKAEAERQMQHAEMMAKAERGARDRLEKERKEDAERAHRHAEVMAEAEREAQRKYIAQRARMEAEVRIQFAAELKAQEEARAAAEARAAEERARREVEDAVLRAEAVRAYEDKIAAEWEAGEERRRWEAEMRAQGAREERERMETESRAQEEEEEEGGQGRRHSIS